MSDAAILREKLRKIEALFAGAATSGERDAAGAAADRIRAQLRASTQTDPETEVRYSIPDLWSRRLFIALCRRYGLKPFRYHRMRHQTLVVRGPRHFLETQLWPQFKELSVALTAYLAEVTERVIREEIHSDDGSVEEVAEPKQLT